ncbi:hypothetical protein DF16_pBMB293orf00075 (plasmid) [Bacillus thuringiensis serovar kurstaki str. YBT-1520]|nr:hypothetical protein DF16_pBMB293orf00075 [Bacillus thuringiensis serovar kurstaki str. YBT-1520]
MKTYHSNVKRRWALTLRRCRTCTPYAQTIKSTGRKII